MSQQHHHSSAAAGISLGQAKAEGLQLDTVLPGKKMREQNLRDLICERVGVKWGKTPFIHLPVYISESVIFLLIHSNAVFAYNF